mmetsp:Transcript_35465/g.59767  ORF Transcript_35465/g.59767 Transcript_35465/m.59767 type:complete len:523 (-) Transcript_35465:410-1978(-)
METVAATRSAGPSAHTNTCSTSSTSSTFGLELRDLFRWKSGVKHLFLAFAGDLLFLGYLARKQHNLDVLFLVQCLVASLAFAFCIDQPVVPSGTAVWIHGVAGASLLSLLLAVMWGAIGVDLVYTDHRETLLVIANLGVTALLACRLMLRSSLTTFQLLLFHAFAIPSSLGWQVRVCVCAPLLVVRFGLAHVLLDHGTAASHSYAHPVLTTAIHVVLGIAIPVALVHRSEQKMRREHLRELETQRSIVKDSAQRIDPGTCTGTGTVTTSTQRNTAEDRAGSPCNSGSTFSSAESSREASAEKPVARPHQNHTLLQYVHHVSKIRESSKDDDGVFPKQNRRGSLDGRISRSSHSQRELETPEVPKEYLMTHPLPRSMMDKVDQVYGELLSQRVPAKEQQLEQLLQLRQVQLERKQQQQRKHEQEHQRNQQQDRKQRQQQQQPRQQATNEEARNPIASAPPKGITNMRDFSKFYLEQKNKAEASEYAAKPVKKDFKDDTAYASPARKQEERGGPSTAYERPSSK